MIPWVLERILVIGPNSEQFGSKLLGAGAFGCQINTALSAEGEP